MNVNYYGLLEIGVLAFTSIITFTNFGWLIFLLIGIKFFSKNTKSYLIEGLSIVVFLIILYFVNHDPSLEFVPSKIIQKFGDDVTNTTPVLSLRTLINLILLLNSFHFILCATYGKYRSKFFYQI